MIRKFHISTVGAQEIVNKSTPSIIVKLAIGCFFLSYIFLKQFGVLSTTVQLYLGTLVLGGGLLIFGVIIRRKQLFRKVLKSRYELRDDAIRYINSTGDLVNIPFEAITEISKTSKELHVISGRTKIAINFQLENYDMLEKILRARVS